MKKATPLIAAVLLCGAITVSINNVAYAQESTQSTDAYTYQARPGDSLSLMARTSVQALDKEDDQIQLNNAQVLFAETNITQSLGSRLLEVGETVSIDKALVRDFATKATALTASQVAAWGVYAEQANFDSDQASAPSQPANETDENSDEPAAPADTDSTSDGDVNTEDVSPETDTEGEQSNNDSEATDQNDQAATTNSNSGGTPWYWWLIGIATVGALYYLLGGRTKSEE